MPREIVIGNGNLLITLDSHLNMRDFYFPYVGQLNHIMGHKNRIGLWTAGSFSWLEEKAWEKELRYLPETLVTELTATQRTLGLKLIIRDGTHFRSNLYLRKITLKNLADYPRHVRLFFTQDFSINQTDVGDTALFDPEEGVLLHYKLGRFFLIGGDFEQYATGTKRFGDAEGTWRDAEDGYLERNPIAQGSVDSAVGYNLDLGPGSEVEATYWIGVGDSLQEVLDLNRLVKGKGLAGLLEETRVYWESWVNKNNLDLADLSWEILEAYKRSLLVVRTQIDSRGAIIAANDSEIMKTNRDHYSYMWPRDGALVAYALDTAGYHNLTRKFFRFCASIISPGGFFLQKYNPDGSLGSSWHPWVRDGQKQLPIQEDETALVLWAFWEHYKRTKDLELCTELYTPLIQKAADFLVSFRDPVTHLPAESYDLWEERRGVFTFTTAAVYGGLLAAANISALLGHPQESTRYFLAAEEVKEALLSYLFAREKDRFIRGVYPSKSGLAKDYTLESSLMAVSEFGVLPASDPRVVSTMQAVLDGLWVKTDIGGLARYTNDYYHQVSQDIHNVPGNPWFITTLWGATWLIDSAKNLEELQKVQKLLAWAVHRSSPAGMMAEQVHPYTGQGLSVSPLTWSHSTFILAVNRYITKYKELAGQEEV